MSQSHRMVDEARLRKHIDDCAAGTAASADAEDIADALRDAWRRETALRQQLNAAMQACDAEDVAVEQEALPVIPWVREYPDIPVVILSRDAYRHLLAEAEREAALWEAAQHLIELLGLDDDDRLQRVAQTLAPNHVAQVTHALRGLIAAIYDA